MRRRIHVRVSCSCALTMELRENGGVRVLFCICGGTLFCIFGFACEDFCVDVVV
jgi:hypothetical protein